MGDEDGLDLEGADSVAGRDDDVVVSAFEPEVALLVLADVITGRPPLAVEGVLVLGVITGHWTSAIGWAIVGAAVAWFCYQAAVNQSLEVASQIRVAFNLYRQEILKQMGLAIPDTVAAERALWQSLTRELLGQPPAAAPTGDGTEPAVRPNG